MVLFGDFPIFVLFSWFLFGATPGCPQGLFLVPCSLWCSGGSYEMLELEAYLQLYHLFDPSFSVLIKLSSSFTAELLFCPSRNLTFTGDTSAPLLWDCIILPVFFCFCLRLPVLVELMAFSLSPKCLFIGPFTFFFQVFPSVVNIS